MEYQRLKFSQMFIDTSKDWRKTGKARFDVEFNHIEFIYKLLGFIKLKFSSEWECHYEADRNVIQVNFEQTHGFKDWIINFLFAAKVYDKFETEVNGKKVKIQLKACKGWKMMWFAMKYQVREAINNLLKEHPDAFIEVIGWSLGSSQASYCAQDVNFNFKKKPYLYTYGSVKPWRGLNKNVREYLKQCCVEAYNFQHRSDIVTYLPPFIGYFATKPVKLGKFNFFGLFDANKWHTEYGEDYLYEKI